MLLYPHPLDYATGLKHVITNKVVNLEYRISPSTFYVEEVVDFSEMGLNNQKGEYAALKLYKEDVEMLKAVEVVARSLNVPVGNLHFYGLKDRSARTLSYIFVKRSLIEKSALPVEAKGIKLELVGFVKSKPKKSHYRGNKFRVLINNASASHYEILMDIAGVIAEVGLPSYYGYQRFGYRRYNSHVLGKYLLLGREDLFALEFLRSLFPLEEREVAYKRVAGQFKGLLYEDAYAKAPLGSGLWVVVRRARNMFLDAYASYLFNQLLNLIIDRGDFSVLHAPLPMPGCPEGSELYNSIAQLEGVPPKLLKRLPCFHREGLFKPEESKISLANGVLTYEFKLRPGMFATVVLREIFKWNLAIE
ncbi:MAG: tRNA pseudouridine(13) synthase TruD [Desulfurococcaceae archaeon]